VCPLSYIFKKGGYQTVISGTLGVQWILEYYFSSQILILRSHRRSHIFLPVIGDYCNGAINWIGAVIDRLYLWEPCKLKVKSIKKEEKWSFEISFRKTKNSQSSPHNNGFSSVTLNFNASWYTSFLFYIKTVFSHLDSFRDAVHFIVLHIRQILVSTDGVPKKEGGNRK
jgi:hypothetical protein